MLWRRLQHDDAGISLVEVLVAAMLMAVGLMALAGVATASLSSLTTSRLRQDATVAVSRAIEATRALDYTLTAHPVGAGPASPFDPDGAGPVPPETVAETAGGVVTGEPYEVTAGNLTVATVVTLVDDPVAGAGAARRVTVIASWAAPGDGGESRQSTVIAEADRGLPAPVFDVAPTSHSRIRPPNTGVCLAHVITNLGDADSYEVVLPTVASHPSMSDYSVAAYADADGEGAGELGEQLSDVTGNGPNFPDTAPVATNETVPLLLCYTPLTPTNGDLVTEVTVQSLFDVSVEVVLSHEIDVTTELTLWLHDTDPTANHSRGVPCSSGQLPMNPAQPTAPTLFNWDTDRDGNPGIPGLQARRGDTGCRARWAYQFTEPTTLSGSTGGTVWIRHNGTGSKTFRLRVELRRQSGGSSPTSLGYTTFTGTATETWSEQAFAAPPLGSIAFGANDRLLLEITCEAMGAPPSGASNADCHLAFDTTAYPSRLAVDW